MPTYDYRCRSCEHAFEHFQGISDPLLRKCPECGRRTLERLFGTGAGVVFKGSGFYETDYKRSGKPPSEGGAAKGDAGDAKPGASGKDASTTGKGAGSGDTGAGGPASSGGSKGPGTSKSGD